MEGFEVTQTLANRPRFTVIEARAKKLGFLVILKKCEYSTEAEAEYYIRSFLLKTKNRVYSNSPLSIFAYSEQATGKKYIVFEWKKGKSVDPEIEIDRKLQLASGNAGYEKREMIHMNAGTGESVERAKCLSLGRKVIIKAFRHVDLMEMNPCFEEALALAKCTHPNICEFLDFRLFQGESGEPCAYIVMERLEQNLQKEMRKRKSAQQPYSEEELLNILIDVTAGLLFAKSLNMAHRDIKPDNILRCPQGLKIVDFGSAWQKGQYSETASAKGTVSYMSPEAWATMNSSGLLQRPFESDVFSLGITMLHLATLEVPLRSAVPSEQEALLHRALNELPYSAEFKQLLTSMLSIDPRSRQTLEFIHGDAMRTQSNSTLSQPLIPGISPQKSSELPQQPASSDRISDQENQILPEAESNSTAKNITEAADSKASLLLLQSIQKSKENKYSEAAELSAEADAIFTEIAPDGQKTAYNRRIWATALREMGNQVEALNLYVAADSIYSRLFPDDKETADNFNDWALALQNKKKYAEAVQKFAAADAIYSRLFPNYKSTANNLYYWGVTLKKMEKCAEAVTKFAAADAIYTQLPSDKDIAENLSEWGVALRSLNNLEEAVIKFAAADAIFSRQFPSEKATANNLYYWAITLKMTKKLFEAIEKFGAANAIYSRHFPNDRYTGDNLSSWGGLLKDMGNNAEAVIKYAAAGAVYSRLNIESDIAENLSDWGTALNNMGKNAEAAEKFAEACAIYTRLAPSGKITANTIHYWGSALKEMKNYAEAATKYASAEAIYSQKFPDDKMTANNYFCWGIVLRYMGNNAESDQKFKSADAIYSRRFPGEQCTANNLKSWGLTLKALGQKKEAIRKIKAAADIYNAKGMTNSYQDCNKKLASLW